MKKYIGILMVALSMFAIAIGFGPEKAYAQETSGSEYTAEEIVAYMGEFEDELSWYVDNVINDGTQVLDVTYMHTDWRDMNEIGVDIWFLRDDVVVSQSQDITVDELIQTINILRANRILRTFFA